MIELLHADKWEVCDVATCSGACGVIRRQNAAREKARELREALGERALIFRWLTAIADESGLQVPAARVRELASEIKRGDHETWAKNGGPANRKGLK